AYGVGSGAENGAKNTLPKLLKSNVTRHLLDTKVGSQTGGTGQAFDWSLINNQSAIMLAGGLNPDNANQAAKLGCLGLDLNSGVESAPGKKDADKLQRAFAAIRNY
ncbi:bifunctional indole-3-glycerol phosphate synthase/phosphoribosylanthranilate isomerase, partial [Vibrio sp. 10N.222.46.B3]